jgi:hypothetical protein
MEHAKTEQDGARRPAEVIFLRAVRQGKAKQVCNLCRGTYLARTRFDRFCPGCKGTSELYHFHEWLPAS